CDDRGQHHREHADHGDGRQPGRRVVKQVECSSHEKSRERRGRRWRDLLVRGICYLRYASITALPSGPALPSQSTSITSPTFFRSVASCAGGWMMFMPLALSWSTYHWFFSSLSFQPRASASAAALSSASCEGLSSALNAARSEEHTSE